MAQAGITTTDPPRNPEPTNSTQLRNDKYFEITSNILSSLASLRGQVQRLALAALTFPQSAASPSADTSSIHSASPTNATLEPQYRNDPFRGAVQIPGCSPPRYVYPHSNAAIDPAFEERYREVVNIFRYNSKEHPGLRENLQYIDYTLKLCGASPKTSCPSIVVFCRHSEFKDLHGLLTSKEMKYQYCLRRQTRKFPWSGSRGPASDEDHRPFFNLYFWRQRRPRTLYWGQQSVRLHSQKNSPPLGHSHMVSGLTMCGSIVEGLAAESSFATMGCVIKIDSEYYAITAMHAFSQSQSTQELYGRGMSDSRSIGSVSKATKDTDISTYNEAAPNGSYRRLSGPVTEGPDYFSDDVEYEHLVVDGDDDDEVLDSNDNRSTSLNDGPDNQPKTIIESKEMSVMFPSPEELDEGELDLDWALIKLTDPRDWRPNACFCPSISSRPIFLSEVARSQPPRDMPVVIITAGTPLSGMLQPGTSMLGGVNGRTPSSMWTMVLSEQNSLKRGDSGSIVVGAENNMVYGHVVGSSPIGEVYISPYSSIIDQIQHRFPGSSVTLPKPLDTLAGLIDFHSASARDDASAGLVRRLQKTYRKATANHPSWGRKAALLEAKTAQLKLVTNRALVLNLVIQLHTLYGWDGTKWFTVIALAMLLSALGIRALLIWYWRDVMEIYEGWLFCCVTLASILQLCYHYVPLGFLGGRFWK